MPDIAALKSAVRAAIVIPAVFAFTDMVIQQPQTSLFAAFGCFALLVFVEFAGSPGERVTAYLVLGVVGAAFITIGTLCSHNALLATAAMAVIGFGVLFSGLISGYFAAASTAAILAFVLPVTIPVPNSAIPDRLEGWAIATAAAIVSTTLLWPPRRRRDLQRQAAGALRAVADVLDAAPEEIVERGRAARATVDGLGRRFLGSQHRPTGPTGPTAALASLPEELDWLLSILGPPTETHAPALAPAEDTDALGAAASVLRVSADRLDGRDAEPDLTRLVAAREATRHAVAVGLAHLPAGIADDELPAAVDGPFRARAVADSAEQVARYAMAATGSRQPARAALAATEETIEHASIRSVWLQNSVRGAAGLAVAVYIAQRTGLQHSFWVVLGTLSVLRSNALGTGWSILSALAGTAVGIVVGALLVIAIGSHEPVLWILLPIAIAFAAYAPRAISFSAGQAAFTVVLFILFNLIQPVGWTVGLVRVEDVAIGFAISLGVGILFWPRGAGAIVRADVADAYARAADSFVATTRELLHGADDGDAARAAHAAEFAGHRLDDVFSQYLAERSATPVNVESGGALLGGANRVRRATQSLASLGRIATDAQLGACAANLDGELAAFQAWYVALGYALVNRRALPPPHIRDADGRHRLLGCIGDATRSRDKAALQAALVLLWASYHLDELWRLESHLSTRAADAFAPAPGRSVPRVLRFVT